jgi:hypothetical protein
MTLASRTARESFASAADLLAAMGWTTDSCASPLAPADPRAVDFLARLSHELLRGAARSFPELVALGFFLRRSEVDRLLADQARRASSDVVRVPRGLVFHVPPANVDTIFVYSWALALLAGNMNVVRLSERTNSPAAVALVQSVTNALVEADPVLAATQRIVSYPHDDVITAALSAACDLRVIWGGDASVDRLRAFPLAPGARELTFPDRFSMAVVGAPGYLAMSPEARDRVAGGLFNDAYWFDQAACASPRLVVLVGDDASTTGCGDDLFTRLASVIVERGYRVDAAMAIEKRVVTAGLALDGVARRVRWHSNELARVDVDGAPSRAHAGAGTFQVLRLRHLEQLVPLVRRRDQTLVHAGLAHAELTALVQALNGRGVDRVVPIGQALTFASVWDGEDLLEAFARRVSLVPSRPVLLGG